MGFEHVTLAVRHLMRALAHLYFYLRQMAHAPSLTGFRAMKGNEKGRQTDHRVARVLPPGNHALLPPPPLKCGWDLQVPPVMGQGKGDGMSLL